MKIEFTLDDNKKLKPRAQEDKRQLDLIRDHNQKGAIIIFDIYADRSTAQHRMYWSILQYAIYASEAIAKEHTTPDNLHMALKWQFCLMCPQYLQEIKVQYNGESTTAKVPFSESPKIGIDSQGMKEYMAFALKEIAGHIGVTEDALKLQSEQFKRGEI